MKDERTSDDITKQSVIDSRDSDHVLVGAFQIEKGKPFWSLAVNKVDHDSLNKQRRTSGDTIENKVGFRGR